MTENATDIMTVARQPFGRGLPLRENEPRTIAKLFIQAVIAHPHPDAWNFKKDTWEAISSHELLERIENIALGLYTSGLRKGGHAEFFPPRKGKKDRLAGE